MQRRRKNVKMDIFDPDKVVFNKNGLVKHELHVRDKPYVLTGCAQATGHILNPTCPIHVNEPSKSGHEICTCCSRAMKSMSIAFLVLFTSDDVILSMPLPKFFCCR